MCCSVNCSNALGLLQCLERSVSILSSFIVIGTIKSLLNMMPVFECFSFYTVSAIIKNIEVNLIMVEK